MVVGGEHGKLQVITYILVLFQVLLTSESSGHLWNVCIWNVRTGTTLLTYKGGSSSPRTLSLLKNDYLMSAVNNKPLIHVWSLQRRVRYQTATTDVYIASQIQSKVCISNVQSRKTVDLTSILIFPVSILFGVDLTGDVVPGRGDQLFILKRKRIFSFILVAAQFKD